MPTLQGCILEVDRTREELIEYMCMLEETIKLTKQGFVATINGFDDDPRELYVIHEVQELCRRMCDVGFPSLLHPSTFFPPGQDCNQFFGGFEIWLIAGNMIDENGRCDNVQTHCGRFMLWLQYHSNPLEERLVAEANAKRGKPAETHGVMLSNKG